MGAGDREPFLLWLGSPEYLNGRSERLTPWLRRSGRFTPAWSWPSPWPGTVLVGLCLLFLVGCASSSVPPTSDAALAGPWFVALGMAVAAAGAVNAVQSWRGRWWRATALSSGQRIRGVVTHAAGRAVVFPGSREEGTGQPTKFYVVTVEFEFPSPSGERLWASEEAVRDDLAGGLTLPAAGQPVFVLYLDDRRFVML